MLPQARSALELRKVITEGSGTADPTYRRLADLIDAADISVRLQGLAYIRQLLESDEPAAHASRCALLLRTLLNSREVTMAEVVEAAHAIGLVVRTGGTAATDIIEYEIGRAKRWLQE
eukprot:6182703-Pleurochrysis_carterae.AAC.4